MFCRSFEKNFKKKFGFIFLDVETMLNKCGKVINYVTVTDSHEGRGMIDWNADVMNIIFTVMKIQAYWILSMWQSHDQYNSCSICLECLFGVQRIYTLHFLAKLHSSFSWWLITGVLLKQLMRNIRKLLFHLFHNSKRLI